jgi:mevalonate kinase
MKQVSGFAPGKLILTGEHSVVYGYHAIAMAVNLGVWVHLEEHNGDSYCDTSNELISEAIGSLLPQKGIKVSIETDLPLGRGMGSSASLSIALIRALAKWEGRESQFEEEFEKGLQLETFFHGNPSGLDHTVSSLGKTLLYQKATPHPKIRELQICDLSLVIIDSGTAGNTAQMVQNVRENYGENKVFIEKMGDCTLKIKEELSKPQINLQTLGDLFSENQILLQKIGVSTLAIESIIDKALDFGSLGAKISGSGGGGIIMCLHQNPQFLVEKMIHVGYKAFSIHPYS